MPDVLLTAPEVRCARGGRRGDAFHPLQRLQRPATRTSACMLRTDDKSLASTSQAGVDPLEAPPSLGVSAPQSDGRGLDVRKMRVRMCQLLVGASSILLLAGLGRWSSGSTLSAASSSRTTRRILSVQPPSGAMVGHPSAQDRSLERAAQVPSRSGAGGHPSEPSHRTHDRDVVSPPPSARDVTSHHACAPTPIPRDERGLLALGRELGIPNVDRVVRHESVVHRLCLGQGKEVCLELRGHRSDRMFDSLLRKEFERDAYALLAYRESDGRGGGAGGEQGGVQNGTRGGATGGAQGGALLDIGGHVGATALFYGALHPDATVDTFEPAPLNFLYLAWNAMVGDATRWNGMGWDGAGRDGMGWPGTRW